MRDQVNSVGIAMIVVGVLNTLLYLGLLAFNMLGLTASLMEGGQGDSSAEQLGYLFGSGIFAFLPLFNVVGGLLWIVAGARLRGFKGRMFAVVMLVLGAIPCCLTHPCCTWIIDLVVAVWGLTVLFSGEVEAAFLEAEVSGYGPLG